MTRAALACLAASGALAFGFHALVAQPSTTPLTSEEAVDAREALEIARQQQRNARSRAERLEGQAAQSREAAQQALQEAAALAARVQQAEAAIAAAEAELSLVEQQRKALDARLAERREPLARLTGALQTMASRPLALSALQSGSLRDVVHTRAVLASTVPVVRARTASLRGELDRARALEIERAGVLADRREAESRLESRRRDVIAKAEQERILARQALGGANREAELAVELAEQARDLDGLVGRLESDAAMRQRLASLDGPLPRPTDGQAVAAPRQPGSSASRNSPERFLLPVSGRVAEGFGEAGASGGRASGLAIVPRPGAQVVSPAAGRVSFAGPYEGFGRIVILEHDGEWTSLVTGLGQVSVEVGQSVTAGSPLGLATQGRPRIAFELRRNGRPVNPLDFQR
ncbi:murein hydrolase activator EnvC family protein [Qipengyuania aquimaris]|uniref:murein hydrolase activator EnvC family protein n=1 Tax=Qipengyuania aquimaris TaxID=255984 RepID=UPI001FD1DCFA|nr:peptidoglycan DD-metalloendopeptidase family protein [Qipengyuania aquimaris]UOR16202.1 peptidoglycan DD-metalloendopeptidase family protein [Qipengyuania aquimaris]